MAAILKKGWREGCRPCIRLDGCHLKSVHKGQLLSAMGIDGNNGIYPIAWAIVEAESRDTWTWFLEFLREDLDIHHRTHYTFMRLELKQKLWAIARSYTMNQFRDALEDMKKSSQTGWQWCMDRPAQHWSKSHFDPKFKCDILLNDHYESFNKSILPARKQPILSCLEDIRAATMLRLANRRQSGPNWRCNVGPRIEKQLRKNVELSHEYRVISSSNSIFEIQGRGVACASGVLAAHSVSLDTRTCTCKRWDISGVSCGNAVAAIHSKGLRPDDFVHEYFTKNTYMKAYEPILFPIAGVAEWHKINRPIAPPLYLYRSKVRMCSSSRRMRQCSSRKMGKCSNRILKKLSMSTSNTMKLSMWSHKFPRMCKTPSQLMSQASNSRLLQL
ncbi:uncharacterized protein LOC133723261 [Rosa rugosa]|uniref:uncharacterized protein LOC133723261 n=1 Tax=Rosa rugosa TaxID=74645 RepID=UPI002B40AB95|nr:uncharacterized protein LOC133723261 [Rosa rugosa]